jgi:hypothetical protein
MNTSMPQKPNAEILDVILQLAAHKEKYSISVHKGDDPEIYILTISDSKFQYGSSYASYFIYFNIGFTIDHQLLYEAYQKIPNHYFDYNITEDEDAMLVFLNRYAIEVLKNLKDINQVADDYNAIASFLEVTRGAIVGERFGI